jgi:hypothetical protein
MWILLGRTAARRPKQAGRAGRKAKLSASQLRKIEQALRRGPEAFGHADCEPRTGCVNSSRIGTRCGIRKPMSGCVLHRLIRDLAFDKNR